MSAWWRIGEGGATIQIARMPESVVPGHELEMDHIGSCSGKLGRHLPPRLCLELAYCFSHKIESGNDFSPRPDEGIDELEELA